MTITASPTAVASDTTTFGAPGTAVLGAHVDTGAGVLAMTGAGPGTIILALAGLGSLLVGAAAMLTGRRIAPRNTGTADLPDLSHRALSS